MHDLEASVVKSSEMIEDYLCGLNNYIYLNLSMLHLILFKTHPLDRYLSQYILEGIYFWSFMTG